MLNCGRRVWKERVGKCIGYGVRVGWLALGEVKRRGEAGKSEGWKKKIGGGAGEVEEE